MAGIVYPTVYLSETKHIVYLSQNIMPPVNTTIRITRGEDVVIPFSPLTGETLTAGSYKFVAGPDLGSSTAAIDVALVSNGVGGYTVTLPSATSNVTIRSGRRTVEWQWEVRRVDAGSFKVVGSGALLIDNYVKAWS